MSESGVGRLADIIEHIVKGLVDDEGAVDVTVVAESYHTNYRVSVGRDDFGKVIGRSGQTAGSLRAIIQAIGQKLSLPSCVLHVEDPNPNRRGKSVDSGDTKARSSRHKRSHSDRY